MFSKKETLDPQVNVVRESLKAKMLAAGQFEVVPLTAGELIFMLDVDAMMDLMTEVDEIRAFKEKLAKDRPEKPSTGPMKPDPRKEPENTKQKSKGAGVAGSVGGELTFDEAVRPLMRYLARSHHPHNTVIVTSTSVELLEGQIGINTNEYLTEKRHA